MDDVLITTEFYASKAEIMQLLIIICQVLLNEQSLIL